MFEKLGCEHQRVIYNEDYFFKEVSICAVEFNILNESRCSNHNHIVMSLKPESLQSFEIGRKHNSINIHLASF